MVPSYGPFPHLVGGAPRASGDGPDYRFLDELANLCSPRERGWSQASTKRINNLRVLPARAGMVRS